MKTRIPYLLQAAIPLLLLAGTTARISARKPNVDGITTASTRTEPAAPLRDDAYVLIGNIRGIKSPVIKYDDHLYRGGWIYADSGYTMLKKMGIKTIISFTPSPEERTAAEKFGFKLIELKIDERGSLPPEYIGDFLEAMEKEDKPIYAHCYSGLPITGTFAALYRTHLQGWPEKRALNEFTRLGGDLTLDEQILQSAGLRP